MADATKKYVTKSELKSMTEITYANLKSLRNSSGLTPGMWYRITDYNTTTTQEGTNAAGHQFDIIVTALSANKLSEEASAIQHNGDTYFSNNNLSAWKIWYCLDNDTTRFAWANTGSTGRGVIYRMIDEFNNDVPYDFKNIQFWRLYSLDNGYPEVSDTGGVESWVYTFSATSYHINNNRWSSLKDGSLESPYQHENDEDCSTFYNNTIEKYIMLYDAEDEDPTNCGKQYLNNNVFFGYWEEIGSGDDSYYYAYCCYGNKMGINCRENTFGYSCNKNKFANYCYLNEFYGMCTNNKFGNLCCQNKFYIRCINNFLGPDCYGNNFSLGCGENILLYDCNANKFGNNCSHNYFKDYCSNNTFGNDCSLNTFEYRCRYNTFGNSCVSNTFGADCSSNKFGNASTTRNYYRYITFEDGNCYIRLYCSAVLTSAIFYQNVTIAKGVNNTSTYKDITDSRSRQEYKTTYQNSSSITLNA